MTNIDLFAQENGQPMQKQTIILEQIHTEILDRFLESTEQILRQFWLRYETEAKLLVNEIPNIFLFGINDYFTQQL